MITEDYVSFETAKLLKEKGFDEPCYMWCFNPNAADKNGITAPPCYYGQDVVLEHGNYYKNSEQNIKDTYAAPTIQMTMKWLREVHKLEINPFHEMLQGNAWWYRIEKNIGLVLLDVKEEDVIYDSYEAACEAAIKYCLENLI